MLRPTSGDPRGAEQHHWNTGAKENQQLNPGELMRSHMLLIILFCQILKENDEKLNIPYVRDIGLDPFALVMFSDKQLRLIKQLSATDSLNIYVDATGAVIKNIFGQRMPYLYSLVVKPCNNIPPVSVAEMITTQNTIFRIDLLLNTVKKSINAAGGVMKERKSESDFSFAIIQLV